MASYVAPTTIVHEVLRAGNYGNWKVCIKNYLISQDLWDIVEATSEPPGPKNNAEHFRSWRKKNAAALHAIQISCSLDIFSQIKEISSAKDAWDDLAKKLQPQALQGNPPVGALPGARSSSFHQFLPLHKAISKGDWNSMEAFLEPHPNAKNAKISMTGKTALHLATIAGHVKIAEELIKMMTAQDLEIKDKFGVTALSSAAYNGMTKIAQMMVNKNENLVGIANNDECIPLVTASARGHRDMTHFLYSVTPFQLLFPENGLQGIKLLNYAIAYKMFDIALDLVERCPSLATATRPQCHGAVITLSNMSFAFFSGSRLSFWQKWIYFCVRVQLPSVSSVHVYVHQNGLNATDEEASIRICVVRLLRRMVLNFSKFLGIKQLYDMKLNHVLALELLHRICREISSLDEGELLDKRVFEAVFNSVRNGITEFIVEIIRAQPDLIWSRDKNSRDIFQSAIEFRQEKIFSLIYGLDARKVPLISNADSHCNNMLHMAGLLAPASQLASISGAALQMQRELMWFKEVESIVGPSTKDMPNQGGEKPYQVFTRNHKGLVIEGEKWMKDTATSSTVVGALIITIMFAAAFTVPGGNNQDTGLPIFLNNKSFKVFILSDAIALFSSSTSVLTFLGILTSRYAQEDFLISLPRKLIIGLSTLFLSIAAMVVAFCAALLIMFENKLEIVIPVILFACVPVTLFVLLQFPLLVEIFISTYGSGIFDRKMKRWY